MTTKILLEIAVSTSERGLAVERAGAHRLELCEQLELGGVTPRLELVRHVRSAVQIPVHVLVRPRAGDFVYTSEEYSRMKEAIAALRSEGVQGIVTGILQPDGSVDIARTRELVELTSPLKFTFHRAFDETPDLAKALEDVTLCGASHILTSGGAPDALQGASVLRKLIEQAGRHLTILPGGGIHSGNIAELASATMACELHTGLGTVLDYGSTDESAFEREVKSCIARLNHF